MRSVDEKWKKKTLRNSTRDFTHTDIKSLIVDNNYPNVITYPFKGLHNSPVSNFTIGLTLSHGITDHFSGRDIVGCIYSINDKPTTLQQIKELPFYLFFLIMQEYIVQAIQWQEYFYQELHNFSESSDSFTYWNLFQHSSLSSVKSAEKAAWVTICKHKDREFWTKFAISIRESLLPWMNVEMYKKVKDAEGNKRENVDYEKQKLAMVEGRLEDIDVTKIEEDIDIIE